MYHRSGACANPLIPDSLKQMDSLLRAGSIMLAPACGDPAAEFCSLVDSAKKSTLNASGKFVKRGHFTHGMDGVRYLAWRFLARNRLPPTPFKFDTSTFNQLQGIRVRDSE